MDSDLIDRIYECAFVPESWPEILGELATIATARAGFLFISNGDIHQFKASTNIGTEVIGPLVSSGWMARSERFKRFLSARNPGFFLDSEIYTPEEKARDPFYRDLLYPRGLGWAVGTIVPLPTGDRFAINLEREMARGPVEAAAVDALNELRPHIARSAFMAARLQLERARAAAQALEMVSLPALVLDQAGKILVANSLIETLASTVYWRANDRVALRDRAADALFRDAIAAIDRESNPSVRSFPIRSGEADGLMVAHVLPIRRSARDIFVRCAAVLVLTPVTSSQAPPVELVQSLFDLTPSEARVARGLASGKTVDDLASESGTSINTVRTLLSRVMNKTGCNRQAEIVSLLAGVSVSPLRMGDT